MLRIKRGSIEWLEFEIFQEFAQIGHAVFLRHGGITASSTGLFKGDGEDMQEDLPKRQARLVEILQCSYLMGGHQVHGSDIKEVPFQAEQEKCDGIFTSREDVGLLIKHADCQAAIIYDPVENVIANIHAGWRGNVQNIYQKTVDTLAARFGSKPENLMVGISPSLGPCCAQFIHFETELPRSFWEFQVKPFYFDLWEVARRQWQEAGVLPHHLQISGICTCCNKEDYFSYRRDKSVGCHHATVILKRQKTP